jgi:hypothetical protein
LIVTAVGRGIDGQMSRHFSVSCHWVGPLRRLRCAAALCKAIRRAPYAVST